MSLHDNEDATVDDNDSDNGNHKNVMMVIMMRMMILVMVMIMTFMMISSIRGLAKGQGPWAEPGTQGHVREPPFQRPPPPPPLNSARSFRAERSRLIRDAERSHGDLAALCLHILIPRPF